VTLPESQAAVPNGTVRFKCTFKGTPPFTVKWFKDDSELMTGPSCFTGLEGLSCFMELFKVGVTHSGAYSCQVSNDAGSVRCSADLTVKGWPLSNSCVAVFISHLHRCHILQFLPFFHFQSCLSPHPVSAANPSSSAYLICLL